MGFLQFIAARFAPVDRRPAPSFSSNRELGRYGEDVALAVARRAGYRLLCRNYRTSFGEIDLVCRHGDVLVFIEVKTRQSIEFGRPAEAVGPAKQRHIIRVAERYRQSIKNRQIACRFDVIEVEITAGAVPVFRLIAGAYTA